MGTRSVIHFRQALPGGGFVTYMVVYQQYDGWYVAHQLVAFLQKVKICSGIQLGDALPPETILCNGMGDLCARYVTRFKSDSPGGFYIQVPDPEEKEDVTVYVTYDSDAHQLSVVINDDKPKIINSFIY